MRTHQFYWKSNGKERVSVRGQNIKKKNKKLQRTRLFQASFVVYISTVEKLSLSVCPNCPVLCSPPPPHVTQYEKATKSIEYFLGEILRLIIHELCACVESSLGRRHHATNRRMRAAGTYLDVKYQVYLIFIYILIVSICWKLQTILTVSSALCLHVRPS